MDVLEIQYKDIEKKRNEVSKKLREILRDKNVQKYIKLLDEYEKLNDELKEVYKEALYKRYERCEHVLVCCGCKGELEYGNKPWSYYGCIKCGLTEEVLTTDYPLTTQEKVMASYLKSTIYKRINGKKIGVTLDLDEATSLYNDLKEKLPDYSEEELIEMFKTKVDLNNVSRKKKPC